jgi:integrase
MKQRFRLFRRAWGTYYCEDCVTKRQESLSTRDKSEAYRLVAAKNENENAPAFSLHLARVYWKAGDPAGATRTWQHVMDEIPKLKTGVTRYRWLMAIKDKALDPIRDLVLLETQAEHFLRVLEKGRPSTHHFLRRIQNFALDMAWLPWPVLLKKRWPVVKHKDRRAITWEEHQAIVAHERNTERRAFYWLAWHLGASQSDIAFLEAENIDWEGGVISFTRKKTGSIAIMRFENSTADLLRSLPASGPLFPNLRRVRASNRATEFKERCDGLGIKGVTLHSYRYSWAERAKVAGYPEDSRRKL